MKANTKDLHLKTRELIAATAWYLACPLLTANDRHYRFIDDLDLQVFQP